MNDKSTLPSLSIRTPSSIASQLRHRPIIFAPLVDPPILATTLHLELGLTYWISPILQRAMTCSYIGQVLTSTSPLFFTRRALSFGSFLKTSIPWRQEALHLIPSWESPLLKFPIPPRVWYLPHDLLFQLISARRIIKSS